ncbi:MAG TPA: class I SAM-dependent methyltransferase [Gammaproteobacteria bacterium]|nr:class I SAM-dependent methyltransferase [Gammaproteobacteria bacterium]
MAKRGSKKNKTLASQADIHVLYQKSVQSSEFEIEFYEDRYREIRGKRKKPMSLREDFCGTALLSTDWCKSNAKRHAIGVDLCSKTLSWAMENNVKPAGKSVADRMTLLNENVLSVVTDKVDVVCAMNFSFCVFETRELLKSYFQNALKGLKEDGLFFCDLMGGTNTIDEVEEYHDIEGEPAIYEWQQASYNPINHHIQCYINFEFIDGSRIDKAFSYSWRLWSLPEIQELLLEAGFSKVLVYWEEFEDDKDPDNDYMVGTGNYRAVTEVPQQESWLAYIVAVV